MKKLFAAFAKTICVLAVVACVIMLLIAVTCYADVVANAVTVTTKLQIKNGNYDQTQQVNAYKKAQKAQKADAGIVAYANGVTNTIPTNNVTEAGYCFFRNLSTTSGVWLTFSMYLQSNDVAVLPLGDTTVNFYGIQSGDLQYWINQR